MRITALICLLLFVGSLSACKKKSKTTDQDPTSNPAPEMEGTGKVTLYFGADSLVADGTCKIHDGAGFKVISITGKTNPFRKSDLFLAIDTLPSVTTTYDLVGLANPGEATLSFNQTTQFTYTHWGASDAAGTVTIEVNGDELTCSFENVPMHYHETANVPPYDIDGTAKGSFKVYK